MARLRLDVKEGKDGPFAERQGYRIIVPGKSSRSRLFQSLAAKEEALRMPPSYSGRSLTPQQIELIRQWIDQGAEWETHWAFVPPKRPPLPEVKDKSWPHNSIDYFVLARLDREGLKPSPETDKVTLLRRVTLDLTGLPPTPAEVEAFLADNSTDAYEKKVDQLLASPHYGERMAMQWLDLARYADTHGYHIDSQREMWQWRDWVINAFNHNMPFDEFTIDQLAGDLLPSATLDQKIATGFNRNHVINFEGGAIPQEYQTEYVVDRVETTATVWMGLTMGCARCHDHKYDPIKQKDFYRFYAFFNNVPEKGLDGFEGNADPVVQIASPDQQKQLDELKSKIAAMKAALPEKEIAALQAEWEKSAQRTVPIASHEALVSHYEFEKDLSDSSGHNQHGRTVRGGVPFDYGVVGKAAEFSGESHAELGDANSFNPTQPFSVALWFNPGTRFEMALLQKIDDSEGHRGFEVVLDKAVWVGAQRRASTITTRLIHHWPDDAIQVRTKERVSHGWRHLTITYDGSGKASGLKLYLEGKPQELEVLQDKLTGSMVNRRPLEVGNKQIGRPYKGQMDDLRIYERTLPVSEVEQLAVHQPIHALLSDLSGACAEAAHLTKDEKPPENLEDPLIEQSQKDTLAYKVKSQCRSEKEKLRDYFLTWAAPDHSRKLDAELKTLQKQKADLDRQIPTSMVMVEMKSPRPTHVLFRGDYRNRTERVEPDVPNVLPPLPRDAPRNRLGLARWLVDPSHPLTARVAVNRFWQMYFGRGIVKTAEDFGSQGEPPSHRELIDWLATEFVRVGWDVKAMQRLIVTSATYRQSSRVTPLLVEHDPENGLLAHGPRVRLPAEIIRDNALAASGLLNRQVGGPSVFPYQPKGLWEEMAFGEGFSAQEYAPSTGKDLYRRSLYTFWKRTVPPPSLVTFDAPIREKCTARRAVTNTPLQALALMNDPTYVEAARALAQRVLTEAGSDPSARISYAFRLAVARQPSPQEVRLLSGLAKEELENYRRNRQAALRLLHVGESPFDPKMDASELAAWTTVASAILNLDETVTNE